MDGSKQYEVFCAQTKNIKELNMAWKQVKRIIYRNFVKNDSTTAKLHTKVLALLFCAWSEAMFLKLIHTPYGFAPDAIDQIKAQRNFEEQWKKCLELGLRKIANSPKSNYIPNIQQMVTRLIESYVVEPRELRNKIAHGQWAVALNTYNTATNDDITDKIKQLDVVKLDIWKRVFISLSDIIEVLIESPERAFHRDFWKHITKIEEELDETKTWTLEARINQLKDKYAHKFYK